MTGNNSEIINLITGLSDSKWSGNPGSVAEIVGLDIRTTPGLVKVQQKLTRLSAASSASASVSPSASTSPSASRSPSASQSISPSASQSSSVSASISPSASASLSPSASISPSASASSSPSVSQSPSASRSPSASASASASASRSPSASASSSVSPSAVSPALAISGFVKVAVPASNGYHFWFDSDSGNIWAIDTTGTITLAYTTVPTAGTAGCSGAREYNGYIYWATQSRLHRVSIADADDRWSNVQANWQQFAVGDADFHPMAIQDLQLFIGDGNQVAVVDEDGTFNNNALDIKAPHRIKCMIAYEFDILLGTYIADTVNRAEIIRWDTVSPSWNTSDPINEAGINAFIQDDNYTLVNAGKDGRIYFYNGTVLEPSNRIPGNYSNTARGVVHPGSVATFGGIPIFGFSNEAGNPALQGIYGLGSYSRQYGKSLTLDFVISENVTANIEIGAILVIAGLIYVAWKRGTVYGIDQLDMGAKYNGAYFTTRMLFQTQRHLAKSLAQVAAYYNALPTGTGFTFSYSINGGAFAAMDDVANEITQEVSAQLSVPNVGSLQIKCAFDVVGNNAPTMEMFVVDLE